MLRFLLDLFRGKKPPRVTEAKKPDAQQQQRQQPRRTKKPAAPPPVAPIVTVAAATHQEVMRRLLNLILFAGRKHQAAGVLVSTCVRCHIEALSESEYHAACHKHGIVLINGSLYGADAADGAKRDLAQRIEGAKGFQCMNCRTIYCSSCLTQHAPAHTYGGKACPKCGNRFERLRRP